MQRSLLFALLVAPLTVCAAAEVPVAVTPPSPANPGAAPGAAAADPAPSIFSVIQDQLGLKLDAIKGPVEVIVIDHIERPSEN